VLTTRTDLQKTYKGEAIAGRYSDERFRSELHRLLHKKQVEVVNAAVELFRPARILEIAPGPGRVTRDLVSANVLVCLEYNDGMIEYGRSACDGKTAWVRGDGFQLPFGQVFDMVYSFRFVRHFHDRDRERLYAEIKRVLRPGGYFLMDAVNERVSKPLREAHPEEYPLYDKLYQPDELRRELTSAGLEPVELLPIQKSFRWQYRSQVLLGPRINWANRLAIRALERLARTDGLEWIVTCRRA
jgi:ubiquinone/menaquinone biosynthesis C-methylase UbiE